MKNKLNTVFKKIQLILGLLSFWALSACASEIIITDPNTGEKFTIPAQYSDVPGIKMLGEYCAAEGGQKIKEVVHVDGYYDDMMGRCEGACWRRLIMSNFEYFEMNVEKAKSYRMLSEAGLWKVYKSVKTDPNCHSKINREIERNDYYDEFTKGRCIAAKKQTKIESRYGYYSEKLDSVKVGGRGAEVQVFTEYVKDFQRDELIAQWKSFLLFPRHLKLNPSATYQCETININTAKQSLIEAVIKTKDSK